jgi:CMP-N-acetylneuraminic acid synthetase
MKVLAIVPARAGSKRVPGKNLRKLGGKELVARSLETCLAAKRVEKTLLSTDSDEALAIAARYPAVLGVRRPAEISTDTALAIEYVRHALTVVGPGFDAVAIVQPSSPFTLAADLDATIELLERSPEADSAVSVMKLDHAVHPAKLKRLAGDKLVPYLEEERGRMASHELPDLYVRNCSVYVIRVRTIEKGTLLGDDSRAYLMPRERSLDINDELDWKFAEFLQRDGGR